MRTRAVVLVALVSLAFPLLAQEQKYVMTMQFSGEKAEAISSYSWGVSQLPTLPGDAAGAVRAGLRELTFSKPVSALSNTLLEACMGGKRFTSAVLKVAEKKDKKDVVYMEVKLVDILVSSIQLSGNGSDSSESVSLSYSGLEYTLTGR